MHLAFPKVGKTNRSGDNNISKPAVCDINHSQQASLSTAEMPRLLQKPEGVRRGLLQVYIIVYVLSQTILIADIL